jgi:hypothetical protein
MLLFSLLATAVLFLVFAGVSTVNLLERHAYMPDVGWQQPKVNASNSVIGGVCATDTATSGFPLATSRQADAPNNCQKATNPLARSMNYALFFAVAAIIAVGAVSNIQRRIP